MLPYWLLFTLVVYFAITDTRLKSHRVHRANWPVQWQMVFFVIVLMVGLRHEVGMDWGTYIIHVESTMGISLFQALTQTDPAYGFLNWIGGYWGGIYLVNTICAVLFAWGLVVFCRAQPLPWIALIVALPFLVIVVAMGYTRQGVAIGIAMLALVKLEKGRVLPFIFWIGIAALFHKSAVILAPLALLARTNRKLGMVVWTIGVTIGFFVLLLQESVAGLKAEYLGGEYQSSGAGIRVVMTVLPALLFLVFRNRFPAEKEQKRFWTFAAVSALILVPLLYWSPSSTAVDRVALYLIPLQLFVWARVPIVFANSIVGKKALIGLIIAYSGVVLMVWLLFAVNAVAWLPYKLYPWIRLWM